MNCEINKLKLLNGVLVVFKGLKGMLVVGEGLTIKFFRVKMFFMNILLCIVCLILRNWVFLV